MPSEVDIFSQTWLDNNNLCAIMQSLLNVLQHNVLPWQQGK